MNEKILDDLGTVRDEIKGSQNPDSKVNIAQYFEGDAACQLALDSGVFGMMNQAGLLGVEKMFQAPIGEEPKLPISTRSKNYLTNRPAYKSELKNIMSNMGNIISKNGVDGFIAQTRGGENVSAELSENSQSFKRLDQLVGKKLKIFSQRKEDSIKNFLNLVSLPLI